MYGSTCISTSKRCMVTLCSLSTLSVKVEQYYMKTTAQVQLPEGLGPAFFQNILDLNTLMKQFQCQSSVFLCAFSVCLLLCH